MQTVKTTLNYGDDSLSLKPYLSKNRDDNYLENEKGKTRIPGPEIPGKVNVVIEKNNKTPETNPSCPHEEKKQIRDTHTSRVEKKENDTYEEEYLNTDENRMIGILTRLQAEDKILEEENRRAAEEEAQRRERLFLIQRKVAVKERERRQT